MANLWTPPKIIEVVVNGECTAYAGSDRPSNGLEYNQKQASAIGRQSLPESELKRLCTPSIGSVNVDK
jgi:hypothetical protein